MDSMRSTESKARNRFNRSLTFKTSYNINNGLQPDGRVFLTTNRSVVEVRLFTGRLRITEIPNNGKTGLVLPVFQPRNPVLLSND